MFRSTQNIFENPWKVNTPNIQYISPPSKNNWNKNRIPKIEEISLWEQIYYEPGNIGIYAAWDPYVDFYMITYNLFIKIPAGVKVFYGKNAIDEVIKAANDAGVDLSANYS